MKQTIYLRADRRGVIGMTKGLPSLYKDEIIIKVNVEVADKVFGNPVIEQKVVVQDWASDIDVQDVQMHQNIITQEEAEMIREKRLERMREILENQGYTITKEEETDGGV
jgi:hypothetical protein